MIFIAGGTGFVGRHLLESLKGSGTPVRCLVRDHEKAERLRSQGFQVLKGDMRDPHSLKGQLEGVKTVVHLVGIIQEEGAVTFRSVHVTGTQNLVHEATASGVGHFFYQSALGADTDSSFKYLRTKAEAEEVVRSSGIPYTIFRPSLIVGQGDGFTERTRQLISAGPVVPVPGRGLARFQPLYIKDWLHCFHGALSNPESRDRTYELGGPEHLTYNEILNEIMKALNVHKKIVHLPMGLTRFALPFMGMIQSAASALGRTIPDVTQELLSLLDQDNICEPDSVQKHFGRTPMTLAAALREFL